MTQYRNDPKWADVPKIPQDDGPDPVVRIMYSDRFTDVMDCFRGVLRLNEFSERTLALTLDVIEVNPANYTAWHYRRKVLDALNANLYEELDYTEAMAIEHPKNYQIWHHRREISTRLQDGSKEKTFTARAIEEDSKNYHAWAHRQWAVRTFQLWDGELAYIEDLLEEDIRNNSAWNHRWFVIKHTTEMSVEVRRREIDFALAKIQIAVHNESPWNYVRGLLRGFEQHFVVTLKEKCEEILAHSPRCVFAAALLVDLYAYEGNAEAIEAAKEIVGKLMNETDRVRAAYWEFRKTTLKVKN
ncbi:hypothetical protein Poli38472_002539 [Pythium oligandrum]|uniref:Protein farnesyltransferase/geranylgeranyltransferase type-1 subunit alpha n=1 Tax=Pythium oligandrum TaxID=41045 RepID=A0A8K1FMF3_PYTOL|nr:hypothetical protein Poli38472_002539 [Pythium oligandrum]|eukprot:TMW63598.1 hypothetical protein Poli38472_002539 [Pythium oligandrum]